MNALLENAARYLNPDVALQAVMGSLIDGLRVRSPTSSERWVPGKPLKLLLAGYVGARNTGADVRVEEMIRQIRWILGDKNIELTIMSTDLDRTAGYFSSVRQIEMPLVYPKFLVEECPRHHGVIACEGSMFKSKFSNALSILMAGALGMASSEGKLSLGYGAEAGAMDAELQNFVRRHCSESLILCRNDASRRILEKLGVRSAGGTDTAWTFQPAPAERGREILRRAGWDGKSKLLIACPINPFWWPIKPDLVKAALWKLFGEYREEHYQSLYFHQFSDAERGKYRSYLGHFAAALRAFCQEKGYFPVLVGMERLDRRACQDFAAAFERDLPILVSDDFNMYDLVSVLRQATLLVSSRFHAIVTSMPGLVPSAGITMDERIRNVLTDRGHPDLILDVDDPELADKLLATLRRMDRQKEGLSEEIGQVLPKQFQLMGEMGAAFLEELLRIYPEFPVKHRRRHWSEFLPPLPSTMQRLFKKVC